MTVGTLIRRLREEQRLTQAEVAELAGVSHAWLSKVENNLTRTPDPIMLKKLARPLQTEEARLLNEAGYLPSGSPAIADRSLTDIWAEINHLLNEVRRRTGGSVTDGSTQKRTTAGIGARSYSFVR